MLMDQTMPPYRGEPISWPPVAMLLLLLLALLRLSAERRRSYATVEPDAQSNNPNRCDEWADLQLLNTTNVKHCM
jgi:hypothetical protein